MAVRDELRRAEARRKAKDRFDSVPPKMRPFTFESYYMALKRNYGDGDDSKMEALTTCKEFAAHFRVEWMGLPRYNLLMVGNVGTGKTGLTIPVLKSAVEAGSRVAYIDFTVFMSECHAADLNDKEASIQNVSKLDMLVIDDLGTAERLNGGKLKTESPDAIRVATQIINYRIQYLLPTIITTNLDLNGLTEQFGQRLASRIVEASAVVWVGGRDMRLDAQPQIGRPRTHL